MQSALKRVRRNLSAMERIEGPSSRSVPQNAPAVWHCGSTGALGCARPEPDIFVGRLSNNRGGSLARPFDWLFDSLDSLDRWLILEAPNSSCAPADRSSGCNSIVPCLRTAAKNLVAVETSTRWHRISCGGFEGGPGRKTFHSSNLTQILKEITVCHSKEEEK